MKTLPWILALVNVVFTLVVFMYAIISPEKNGLLPILVYFLDLPASLGAEWLRDLLHDHFGLVTKLTIDCLVYTVVGFVWFYLIGTVLRMIIVRLVSKTSAGLEGGEPAQTSINQK